MFCTQCGKQNQDDAVFCNACGTKIGAQNASQPSPIVSIALRSVPPTTVRPAEICMFKQKNMGIAMELDGVWGEKVFSYLNPQDLNDDCFKLFEALQQLTKNMVMQFDAEDKPVVPIYRITKVHANDWWKRMEIEIDGAGGQWFSYSNKHALHADHNMLMNLMAGGR